MALGNLRNQYEAVLGEELFGEIPKSVFAAIAISALTYGGDDLQHARRRIAAEWDVLHANGIVPQKPGKHAKDALHEREADATQATTHNHHTG